MSVSNLNGAAWRLYRHINRYSQMSVLYGSNLSSVTAAGDAQPAAAEGDLYRYEAEYFGQPSSVGPAMESQSPTMPVQRTASAAVHSAQPIQRNTQAVNRMSSPPPAANLAQPVSSSALPASSSQPQPSAQPIHRAAPQNNVTPSPIQNGAGQQVNRATNLPSIAPVIQRDATFAQQPAAAQPVQSSPTQAAPASQVQRSLNQGVVPNQIARSAEMPLSQPTLSGFHASAAQPQIPVGPAEPVQRVAQGPQIQPAVNNPAVASTSNTKPVVSPASSVQRIAAPSPTPAQSNLGVDRAQAQPAHQSGSPLPQPTQSNSPAQNSINPITSVQRVPQAPQIQPAVNNAAISSQPTLPYSPAQNLVSPVAPVQRALQVAHVQPTVNNAAVSSQSAPSYPSAHNPVSPASPIQRVPQAPQVQPTINNEGIRPQPVKQPAAPSAVPVQRLANPVVARAEPHSTAGHLPQPAPASPAQNIQRSPIAPQSQSISEHGAGQTQPAAQSAAVAPAAPRPAPTPKIDRAQQDRMGQMASHNPDMVKVPKYMNDTQVWNGLSRINNFHAAREADDDPRTPWERKVVQKKPVRPKKILRRTAVEEVGRPKKKKKVQPLQRSPKVDEVDFAEKASAEASVTQAETAVNREASREAPADTFATETPVESSIPSSNHEVSREAISREAESKATANGQSVESSSTQTNTDIARSDEISRSEAATANFDAPAQPANFDNTPSLEDVWPVQRLDDTSSMLANNGSDPDLVNLDPPSRPIVNRQEQSQAADVQAAINRVESAQYSESSIDFVPPTRPRPQILRKPKPAPVETPDFAEPHSESSAPVQREPYGVQTGFGELPSDLWNLVGDQPPAQTQKPAAQRTPDAQSTFEPSATINRSFAVGETSLPSQPIEPIHRADDFSSNSDFATAENFAQGSDLTSEPAVLRQAEEAADNLILPSFDSNQAQNVQREPAERFEPQNTSMPVQAPQPGADVQREEAVQPAHLSSWDFIGSHPNSVNRRFDDEPAGLGSTPETPIESTASPVSSAQSSLAPASFRPIMRDADLFEADTDLDSGDSDASFDEPSPETEPMDAPVDPLADLNENAMPNSAMVFADPELAEANSENSATPVEVGMPQLDQPATLFSDAEEMLHVASQAEPKAESESVLLFASEDLAEEQFDAPTPVALLREEGDGEAAQAFGDEEQIASLTEGGDAGTSEPGLTLYPSDDSVQGDAIELKIKINGDDELLVGFADSNQLSQFMDEAAAADATPGLMLFPSEGGDGEEDFDPVPFLLQRQGEQELVIGFADEAMLDAFLSEATEVERGPTALIYAEQEAADEDLENPAEVHFRSAEGNDVLLGYADTEALEELIQAAEEISPEQDLNELTQLVYGRLRQQLLVENERRGMYG
ncbi:MAG: hypothetical protein AAGD96_08970 [Chloroflexota bacterium]